MASQSAIDEAKRIIASIEDNIGRLEATVNSGSFQKGYNDNCESAIASYKTQITNLKSKYNL